LIADPDAASCIFSAPTGFFLPRSLIEAAAPIPLATEPVLWSGGSLVPAEDFTGNTITQEYARFTGTWRFLWVEVEGRRVPAETLRHSRLVLTGNRFLLSGDPVIYRCTFTLRLAQEPKGDGRAFHQWAGSRAEGVGIYELVGDVYTACFGLPGAERSSEFVSWPGSGHVLEVLRRKQISC
jgi:uncharacterized protein (TIGR03067 family)